MSRYTRTVHAKRDEHIYVRRQRPSRQTYSGDNPLFDIIGLLLLISFVYWVLSIIWPLLLIGGIVYLVGANWETLSKNVFIPSLRFIGQVLLLTGIVIKIISLQVWRGTSAAYQICRKKYRHMRTNQNEIRIEADADNSDLSEGDSPNLVEAELLPPSDNFEDNAGEWDLVETQVPKRIVWR